MKYNFVRNIDVFKRYIHSYLLVLVIPLIISSIGYGISMKTVSEQVITHQLTAQKNTVSAMDSSISMIDEMALQLRLDKDLEALTFVNSKELRINDMMRMINARKKAGYYISNNTFKERYYIIYPQNGIVLTYDEVLAKLQFWYENFFSFEDVPYEQWLNTILECKERTVFPEQNIKLNGTKLRAIPYVIPIGSMLSNDKRVVIYLLEKSHLQKIMGRENGSLISDFVLDQYNNVVYTYGESMNADILSKLSTRDKNADSFFSNGSIIIYVTSQINGWKYVSVIPNHVIMGNVVDFRNFLLTLTGITLFLGLVFVWYNSNKAAYPVITALDLMMGYTEETLSENFHQLDSLIIGIKQLISKNANLLQDTEKQNEQLKSMYVERILTGKKIDYTDDYLYFDKDLQYIFDPSLLITVTLIKLTEHSKLPNSEVPGISIPVLKELLANLLKQSNFAEISTFMHSLKQDEIVIFIADCSNSVDKLKRYIEDITAKLVTIKEVKGQIAIGIGSSCYGLHYIEQSYRRARYALAYLSAAQMENSICWADEIPKNINRFIFPSSTELALITAFKSDKSDDIKEIFEQIYYDNFLANQLSTHMQRCLIYNVYCTYIKCIPMLNIDDKNTDFEILLSAEDNIQDYAEILRKMSSIVIENVSLNARSFDDGSRIQKILEYIHNNYNKPDLDISYIAEKFGLSNNYFSQYFKEQQGERFSDYLERYRIEKAAFYLSEENISVQETAQLVGYSNVYTFRRAFKRVLGIVPTSFREQNMTL